MLSELVYQNNLSILWSVCTGCLSCGYPSRHCVHQPWANVIHKVLNKLANGVSQTDRGRRRGRERERKGGREGGREAREIVDQQKYYYCHNLKSERLVIFLSSLNYSGNTETESHPSICTCVEWPESTTLSWPCQITVVIVQTIYVNRGWPTGHTPG